MHLSALREATAESQRCCSRTRKSCDVRYESLRRRHDHQQISTYRKWLVRCPGHQTKATRRAALFSPVGRYAVMIHRPAHAVCFCGPNPSTGNQNTGRGQKKEFKNKIRNRTAPFPRTGIGHVGSASPDQHGPTDGRPVWPCVRFGGPAQLGPPAAPVSSPPAGDPNCRPNFNVSKQQVTCRLRTCKSRGHGNGATMFLACHVQIPSARRGPAEAPRRVTTANPNADLPPPSSSLNLACPQVAWLE